jgi:hypothetical protein
MVEHPVTRPEPEGANEASSFGRRPYPGQDGQTGHYQEVASRLAVELSYPSRHDRAAHRLDQECRNAVIDGKQATAPDTAQIGALVVDLTAAPRTAEIFANR